MDFMDVVKLINLLPSQVKVIKATTTGDFTIARFKARISPYIKGKLSFTSKKAKHHFDKTMKRWSRIEMTIALYRNRINNRLNLYELKSHYSHGHPHLSYGDVCIDLSLLEIDDNCEIELAVAKVIMSVLAIVNNIEIRHYPENSYTRKCYRCGMFTCGLACEKCGSAI